MRTEAVEHVAQGGCAASLKSLEVFKTKLDKALRNLV